MISNIFGGNWNVTCADEVTSGTTQCYYRYIALEIRPSRQCDRLNLGQ